MIHPEDKKYLESEREKVHDTYDHSKTMTDLLVTQAYAKGYARCVEELREQGFDIPNPHGYRGQWPKAVK